MSTARAQRDRLEALHVELAAARAPTSVVTADELQRFGDELRALNQQVGVAKQRLADEEAHLWDALLAVRRVQGQVLANLSQYGDRGRGGLSPGAALGLFGGFMGLVLGAAAAEQASAGPLRLAAGLLCALAAPGVGWYAWHRARISRAIEVAQRLL